MEGISANRAQSAMEYLITYGWAILIIAIVMAALFSLGLFAPSSVTSTGCLPSAGYLCSNPVLEPNGLLTFEIGTLSSTIQINGIACLANGSFPTSFQKINKELLSGYSEPIGVECPVTSNAVGTGFDGVLWLNYTGSQLYANSIIIQLGLISVKVS